MKLLIAILVTAAAIVSMVPTVYANTYTKNDVVNLTPSMECWFTVGLETFQCNPTPDNKSGVYYCNVPNRENEPYGVWDCTNDQDLSSGKCTCNFSYE